MMIDCNKLKMFEYDLSQAEGLTAIEAWVIVCVLFVFGALVGMIPIISQVGQIYKHAVQCLLTFRTVPFSSRHHICQKYYATTILGPKHLHKKSINYD